MGNNEICPKCGYARIYPVDNIFGLGSNAIYEICTNCGYILGMRVEKPNKFK